MRLIHRFLNWLYLRLPPRPAKPRCRICETRQGAFQSPDLCGVCANFSAALKEVPVRKGGR